MPCAIRMCFCTTISPKTHQAALNDILTYRCSMEMKQSLNSIHALLMNTQAKKLAAPSAQSTEHLNNMIFSMSKTNSLILSTSFQRIPAISMAEIPKLSRLR